MAVLHTGASHLALLTGIASLKLIDAWHWKHFSNWGPIKCDQIMMNCVQMCSLEMPGQKKHYQRRQTSLLQTR